MTISYKSEDMILLHGCFKYAVWNFTQKIREIEVIQFDLRIFVRMGGDYPPPSSPQIAGMDLETFHRIGLWRCQLEKGVVDDDDDDDDDDVDDDVDVDVWVWGVFSIVYVVIGLLPRKTFQHLRCRMGLLKSWNYLSCLSLIKLKKSVLSSLKAQFLAHQIEILPVSAWKL